MSQQNSETESETEVEIRWIPKSHKTTGEKLGKLKVEYLPAVKKRGSFFVEKAIQRDRQLAQRLQRQVQRQNKIIEKLREELALERNRNLPDNDGSALRRLELVILRYKIKSLQTTVDLQGELIKSQF